MATPTVFDDPTATPKPRKRLLLKSSLIATAVLLALLLWKCGSGVAEGKRLSGPAVERFHQQLDAQDYGGIYRDADSAFRESMTKEDSDKLFGAIHRKLGNVQSSAFNNINVNATTSGTFITTVFVTSFANGNATETFIWVKGGDMLSLRTYNIQSKALLPD